MAFSKPEKSAWNATAPNTAEPASSKKNVGWLPAERPPSEWFNWIMNQEDLWNQWTDRAVDLSLSMVLRSSATISWDGADIAFTADLQFIWKDGGDTWTTSLALADSPITLADGDVVVAIFQDATSAMSLQAVYANLLLDEYAIEPEANLTKNTEELEIILFRRRGSNLEIPLINQIVPAGTIFNPGEAMPASGALPPIGTVTAFDDFNGTVAFDTDYYDYMDGGVVADAASPLNGKTRRDCTGRVLIGFVDPVSAPIIEGDGTIATAGAMGAVGNAAHIVNLQHLHDISHGHADTFATNAAVGSTGAGTSHSHTSGTHTHIFGVTSASAGTVDVITLGQGAVSSVLTNIIADATAGTNRYAQIVNSADGNLITDSGTGSTGGEAAHTHDLAHSHTVTGAVTAFAGNSANALSATTNIMMRSEQMRFIIRYK